MQWRDSFGAMVFEIVELSYPYAATGKEPFVAELEIQGFHLVLVSYRLVV